MQEVLAIALQSMQQDMQRLDRISLNVANVTTPGYQREVVHQQIDAVEQLPKTKQQFVSQMLETVLAQASH